MWVLEARYNAEKVSYPFIWEKTKENSNVIDYNINEEITKDTSWVINANNQTTTGMANIIPWINAPKLIADTSIAWIDVDQEWSYYGSISAESYTQRITVEPWNSPIYPSLTPTILSNTLPFEFSTDGKGLVFPRGWWYNIVVKYYGTWQDEFVRNDTLYLGSTQIWTHSWWSTTSITYQVNVKKWDVLWFECYFYNAFPDTTVTKRAEVEYTITPK